MIYVSWKSSDVVYSPLSMLFCYCDMMPIDWDLEINTLLVRENH